MAGAARRRSGRRLPALQRGLPRECRGRRHAPAAGRGGDPPGPSARDADARRAGGGGSARAYAPARRARDARLDAAGDLVPLEEQDRSRWDHAAIAEGVGAARRRAPAWVARHYQHAGGDRAVPRDHSPRVGHRLGAHRRDLRRAVRVDADPGRRAEPCDRGGDGGRSGGRPRARRRARRVGRARRLPDAPRDPRRPAAARRAP